MAHTFNNRTKLEISLAICNAEGKGIASVKRLMKYPKDTLCRIIANDHPDLSIKKLPTGATLADVRDRNIEEKGVSLFDDLFGGFGFSGLLTPAIIVLGILYLAI